MTDPDTLRAEVRAAMRTMNGEAGGNRDAAYEVIETELLRLAKENSDLLSTIELDEQVWIQRDETMHKWIERAKRAEAELAALRARIAEAPFVSVRVDDDKHVSLGARSHPKDFAHLHGKRVRLVREGQ